MSNHSGATDTAMNTRTDSPNRDATTGPSAIAPDITVNELLAARPEASGLLLELGIDTCCGGSLPLGEAAADAGVDFDRVVALLETEAALDSGAPVR